MAVAGFLAAGCGSSGPPEGQIGHVEGNFGGVFADEPRAALVGRDILSSGGNAIDAAVAMYFALSVTYPDAATLGGEGVCLVHGSDRNGGIEAIEFQPLLVRREGRTIAIPGAVRGMFALHARYGRLSWAQLLNPAERIARFGNQVSRAFAVRLAAAVPGAFDNPEIRRIFAPGGRVLTEGQPLRQATLSSTLAAIRFRGAGDMYMGELAKRLADGLGKNFGVPVSVADIRGYRPVWLKTEHVTVGNHQMHVPAGAKGTAALALWKRLSETGAPSVFENPASASGESTGFGAIDTKSGAAACTVGAHGALNSGRIFGETGILQAGPRPPGLQYPGLPMILINAPRNDTLGIATGSGTLAGESRAVGTAAAVFLQRSEIEAALSAAGSSPGARTGIAFCPKGIAIDADICRYGLEPGTHGLAVNAAP